MDEQDALVNAILRLRRIQNRIIVLCEGELHPLESAGAPSPQMYGRLAQMPDANFYKNCVPPDWHSYRLPQFFNCGGRSQVLYVYRRLIQCHQVAPNSSYLAPEKLYALVDLDIQPDRMPEGYPWQTTEDVHAALYQNGLIKGEITANHRIWVTALIHKEAFFVFPNMAAAWADSATPFFGGAPLDLRLLHEAVAQRLTTDEDVASNLTVVASRLARFNAGAGLDCTDVESVRTSWRDAAAQADVHQYDELLRAVLSVARVKPVWSQITPDPRWEQVMPAETFRDQLALKVAGIIAEMAPDKHPLSHFFAWLKNRR